MVNGRIANVNGVTLIMSIAVQKRKNRPKVRCICATSRDVIVMDLVICFCTRDLERHGFAGLSSSHKVAQTDDGQNQLLHPKGSEGRVG